MDHLRDYRALVAVIDAGNFTAAAALLGLPRSTLSTIISSLEDRLGARLLHRTTRAVTPTEEGLRLAHRARGVIDEAHGLETMFRKGTAISGRVRMSMPGRIAHHIVIPALPRFLEEHPDLLLDLRISDDRLDLVSEGLDLVLRVGMLEDSSLICRRLTMLRFVNCAAPVYLERCGTPASCKELSHHRAVSYGRPEAGGWVSIAFGKREVRLKASLAVDSTEGYCRAGLTGLGIISLPRFDVEQHLAEGDLIEVLPDHPPEPSDMAILYASRKHLPLRIETVRDWLSRLIAARVTRR
ncbi:MAG: LysR family transcriptional regulator [Erythrobacter sp.]